jgi:hypothetical protein
MTAAEADGERSTADAAAKMLAIARPTGVATTKPAFFFSSRTPGVASACSARKPALVTNARETRNRRASSSRRAASPARYPSTTLSSAVIRTSQKWAGWCSQWKSSLGRLSSSASPARGIASGISQRATAGEPNPGGP